MLRSIGLIACGTALLCSTVWAEWSHEDVERIRTIAPLVGGWVFHLREENLANEHVYIFSKMNIHTRSSRLSPIQGIDQRDGKQAYLYINEKGNSVCPIRP